MALCLAESLIEGGKREVVDKINMLERYFPGALLKTLIY
ncbi:MAG: hypothetical protein H6Q42_3294, partial [Deltaproteobacteria bacterium]|nr:hypothetical protein [Deltaproteobacteria bacterium]